MKRLRIFGDNGAPRRGSARRHVPAVETCEARALMTTGMSLTYTFQGYNYQTDADLNPVTIQFNGDDRTTHAGRIPIVLADNGKAADVTTYAFCVILTGGTDPGTPYAVTPQSSASLPNGGQLAYLVNHFNTASLSPYQATGLQLAIWQAEYGNQFSVVTADPSDLQAEQYFLQVSAGQNEQATYFHATDDQHEQDMLVDGQNYTQGFWKNHPDAWPVSSLTIGGQSYTESQLIRILQTPVQGNAVLNLEHQLIAAELNVINGAIAPGVIATIDQANADLAGLGGVDYVSSSDPLGQELVELATALDQFNSMNGG